MGVDETTLHILMLLRRIRRAVEKDSKRLEACCKLTEPQFACLRQLSVAGPSTPGELASAVYLSRATVTGILDRLSAKGYVTRERSGIDRRRICLELTEAGRELLENVSWPSSERLARGLSTRSPEERTRLEEAMLLLAEFMDSDDQGPQGAAS